MWIDRRFGRRARLTALVAALLFAPTGAEAGVMANINLSSQRMDVYVQGQPRHSWPVSTARRGYRTPVGTFRPQAMKVWHRSTIYDGSPMPHSIFFSGNYAIHGSYHVESLGRPASHGCVRLHPRNAAALYSLVRRYGAGNTVIRITQ